MITSVLFGNRTAALSTRLLFGSQTARNRANIADRGNGLEAGLQRPATLSGWENRTVAVVTAMSLTRTDGSNGNQNLAGSATGALNARMMARPLLRRALSRSNVSLCAISSGPRSRRRVTPTRTRQHLVMILTNCFVPRKLPAWSFKLVGEVIHKGPRMRMDRRNRQREIWRVEMLATGNLLLDALELERYLKVRYLRKPADDLLAQWKRCRRTVNRLARDYAVAIARYRTGIRNRFTARIGT